MTVAAAVPSGAHRSLAGSALCRVAHEAWALGCRPGARRFARALRDPEAAQARILERLLRRNAASDYGRRHGFASVGSVEAYRRRVPVVGYDGLAPWIERIHRGGKAVLTVEPVRRLVPTSGSTTARKLIPWTRTFGAEWGRALRPWLHDLLACHPDVKGGPAYWSVSPALGDRWGDDLASEVPVGFDEDSAYLGRLLQPLVRSTLAVPEEIRHVTGARAFHYLTALGLLRAADLRLVSVWHPSFFGLVLDAMERHWEALVRDVARGTVTAPPPAPGGVVGEPGAVLPPVLRDRVRSWFRRDAARAGVLEGAGPAGFREIWPRLTLVSCWADGASAGPAEALRRRLAGARLQPKGLLATEGVVTVPFAGARPAAVRSHFLEFPDDDGRAHTLSEIRDGETYGVVLTTGAGLYRYRLGDRVRVDGFLERTPCLRFLGREDRCSDLCGEKLHEAFVAGVAETLFGAHSPAFAMLAPDPGDGPPGYTLYVESDGPLPEDLAHRLDRALSANPHYRYCRRLGQLRPAAALRVAAGAQTAYLEREAASGRRVGDVKPAALSVRDDWSRHLREADDPGG